MCCYSGLPGLSGLPGEDGLPGLPGLKGDDGESINGEPGERFCPRVTCKTYAASFERKIVFQDKNECFLLLLFCLLHFFRLAEAMHMVASRSCMWLWV